MIGLEKSYAMQLEYNNLYDDKKYHSSINVNILEKNNIKNENKLILENTFREADLIIDVSTSTNVMRCLCYDLESNAKRISLFLTPSGVDSVLLCEDNNRKNKLDFLEMSYYRFLIKNSEQIKNHLTSNDSYFRYGYSCSDITSEIPQDLISIHSGICSRAIINMINENYEKTFIWRINPENLNIQTFNIPISNVLEYKKLDWTIFILEDLLKELSEYRKSKLPNETGGILLGYYDLFRNHIYIIDTIFSPKDSIEHPLYFIRGNNKLKEKVKEINNITQTVNYIGEWHSHPDNCSSNPSEQDLDSLNFINNYMNVESLPALMLIVSDNLEINILIK